MEKVPGKTYPLNYLEEKGRMAKRNSRPTFNKSTLITFPRKGEIWLLKNPERIKEIGKDYRPVLIISNNERNEYDNSVVVLPITTDDLKNILPVEVFIKNTLETGLDEPSKILCDSPFT